MLSLTRKYFQYILLMSIALIVTPPGPSPVSAQDSLEQTFPTTWDRTVNSLLVTGMYGFDSKQTSGLSLRQQHADLNLSVLSQGQVNNSDAILSFSYKGSSGLLGFLQAISLLADRQRRYRELFL